MESDELSFNKGDILKVIKTNSKKGWLYSYKDGNSEKKGLFLEIFVTAYNGDSKKYRFIFIYTTYKKNIIKNL